jgi:4-amino-4-deoxy-L-arabinose transferase-like glycosyltransferase
VVTSPLSSRRFWAIAGGLALFHLALHVAIIGRFDYHRDELYFIACGRRLAFGYVDHPPLVPWIAALADRLGASLFALRILPALAGAGTILLAGLAARELGGGARAVGLACLCVLVGPAVQRMSGLLCIPIFEQPLWTLASFLVLRILRGARPTRWLAVGAVVGVGLLAKHSMLLWIAGMGVGLVATRARRELATPWPWAGFAIAAAMFATNLVWQAQHGWATAEFLRNMSSGVLARVPRVLFLLGQLLYMNPFTAPVWIAGIVAAWRAPVTRPFALSFLTIVLALLVTRGKPYYLAPAYPMMFAFGAVAIERWAPAHRLWPIGVAALAASGVAFGLYSLPLLPVATVDRITEATLGGVVRPEQLSGELHDEFGWREQAAAVARVRASLPADERDAALVLAGNYGEASAIEFFGRGPVASGHLNWHMWGVVPAEVVIALGYRRETLDRLFSDVREAGRAEDSPAISYERSIPVYVCRAPRVPLTEAWPSLRRYWN